MKINWKKNSVFYPALLCYAIVFFCALHSCGPSREEIEMQQKVRMPVTTVGNGYSVIVIDGCEYIEYDNGGIASTQVHTLTHKGNCKNWEGHHADGN